MRSFAADRRKAQDRPQEHRGCGNKGLCGGPTGEEHRAGRTGWRLSALRWRPSVTIIWSGSARFWPKALESGANLMSEAALRRAVALFDGLLRAFSNRKKPPSESCFEPEDVGACWTLAGETPLMIRRLILPLTFAVVTVHAGQAFAQ